ncbi:hypothetical protein V5O48_014658 [Marasmius crinis-equi]|uniref:Uncharacterized protein n=1 Tax=Marasmius crinis-equi TaxID=585013 RepID=A0ABR3EWR7_9AGAR
MTSWRTTTHCTNAPLPSQRYNKKTHILTKQNSFHIFIKLRYLCFAGEEVVMVKEEMSRTLEYLSWAGRRWEELSNMSEEHVDKSLMEGQRAYAVKQTRLQAALRMKFKEMWKKAMLEEWD